MQQHFQNIGSNTFNIFAVFDLKQGNELGYLLNHLFIWCKLYESKSINPQQVFEFFSEVQKGYHDNPYHNAIHASDVVQTCHFYIDTCQFQTLAKLTPLECATIYTAAAVHDYDHPGVNNPFLINTRSELAITYNDRSPLENHHVAKCFFTLREDKFNFLSALSKPDLKLFRERLIGMILGTDNSVHFTNLGKLKGRLGSKEFDPVNSDKNMCLEALLHAADISNPFKPYEIYEKWTHRVLDEFFNQGDQERELTI